jgi:hypothetical protein
MQSAQLAGDAVTSVRDQAGAAGTRAVTPVTHDRGPRKAWTLRRRVPKSGGSYRDPLFERPDLVEDDYHRFRNRSGRRSR